MITAKLVFWLLFDESNELLEIILGCYKLIFRFWTFLQWKYFGKYMFKIEKH